MRLKAHGLPQFIAGHDAMSGLVGTTNIEPATRPSSSVVLYQDVLTMQLAMHSPHRVLLLARMKALPPGQLD